MPKMFAAMMPLAVIPLLVLMLFFFDSRHDGIAPFSMEAVLQPYSGENSALSTVLAAIAIVYPAIFVLFLFRIYALRGALVLFAMSETPAMLGFMVGIVNYNLWAALPFFALSLGLYGFVFARTSGQK
ncbi:MAG: hypothetical protein AB1324_01990 [Candidatus Micrarchaeota archaeon]